MDCLFGFNGRPVDQATGLQNNLNRWYDSCVGGWLSKDPAGFLAGDSNTQRYCGNNPTSAIDPSGLLKVYIWYPSVTNRSPFGHAAIMLENTTYISWWGDVPMASPCGTTKPDRNLPSDILEENRNPSVRYVITGLDEARIQTWWDMFQVQNRYNAIDENCASVVMMALMVGGAPLANTSFCTPLGVENYLSDNALIPKIKKPAYGILFVSPSNLGI